jgi:AcrR family transcriptional regulator
MTDAKALTSKGKRSAGRVLQAATTVLARDGFGGATLSRIADEAGLDKRTILYYYGSREALLVRVVQTVGERIVQHIEAAIADDADPAQMAETAVATLWAGVTSAPELARAYFALIGGGAGAPVVEDALRTLKQAYLDLILRQLHTIEAVHGRRLGDSDAVATFALALLRGLLLEWTEAGDSEEVQAGLRRFKRLVARELALAPG